jgi:flagellar protein FlaG
VNISSVSTEIGLTLHAGSLAKASDAGEPSKKTGGTKSSTTNPTSPSAAELAELGQTQSVGGDKGKTPVPLVVNGLGQGLKFSLDKDTNTHVIEVIDLESGEVVRQIPPKEVLNFLRQLRGTKGLFVSRRL